MSGIHKYPRGKPTPTTFILSCQRAVFTEEVIHEQWLPAEQLLVHMHTKFNISEDIHFSQGAMMKVVNKVFANEDLCREIVKYLWINNK